LDHPLPKAVSAEGIWIKDSEGKRYLDASGGALVVNLGHGREEIARAVEKQLRAYYYVHPTMFEAPIVNQLAAGLAAHAPAGIERFYFHASGSEAVEAALKLARQIHLAAGRPQRATIIGRWKSYHGLTLGALGAMGRTLFRAPYAPMLKEAVHIPPPYCLRCSYGLTPDICGLRCAQMLAETIENLDADTVSAFIAETVSGGTLACYPPPPGYWELIREICDHYGVLLILDEVLCGMGRTGRWFAADHYSITPDIVTLGKGISSGAVALSAVGVQRDHFETVRKGSGAFIHGGTFSHHPVAAAAGVAVLDILEREQLVERVAQLGHVLGDKLHAALSDHPHVADVRGIGFMWGIELVQEQQGLVPFPRSAKITEQLWARLFEKGLVVYKSTGLAGADGDALIVAPPFILPEDKFDYIADTIRTTLDEELQ
jgi:adenosylmethionine-8-amino-7-oxononanoate aminotransferase